MIGRIAFGPPLSMSELRMRSHQLGSADMALVVAKLKARVVELEADAGRADRLEQALGVICSTGVPSHLTPYGSVRAIAAFAIGKTDDPFYRDGEKLLNAAVSVCSDSRKEEEA